MSLQIISNCINYYWSIEDMRAVWYEHLSLTKSETIAILTAKYAEGITIFERIEKLALIMADMFTGSIVEQYPAIFDTMFI